MELRRRTVGVDERTLAVLYPAPEPPYMKFRFYTKPTSVERAFAGDWSKLVNDWQQAIGRSLSEHSSIERGVVKASAPSR